MSDTTPDTGTTPPEPTETAPAPPDTGTVADETTDWKAEAEKFKALARKHEDRAKANATAAKDLEQLRQASMSDQEKAVDAARVQAVGETLAKVGGRLVDAEVRVAAQGRIANVDALLEGLDRSRFLTDDGEPNVDEIRAWVDRIVPPADAASFPDLGQGGRGSTASTTDPLLAAVQKLAGARR